MKTLPIIPQSTEDNIFLKSVNIAKLDGVIKEFNEYFIADDLEVFNLDYIYNHAAVEIQAMFYDVLATKIKNSDLFNWYISRNKANPIFDTKWYANEDDCNVNFNDGIINFYIDLDNDETLLLFELLNIKEEFLMKLESEFLTSEYTLHINGIKIH